MHTFREDWLVKLVLYISAKNRITRKMVENNERSQDVKANCA